MNEELYEIKGYEGLYAITKDGRVWSYPKKKWHGGIEHNGKWINQTYDQAGYLKLNLWKNKKRNRAYIHRLIGETFIKNQFNKQQINHKNGIKTDNRIENLEWCTNQENCIHAWKTGLRVVTKKMMITYKLNGLKNKGNKNRLGTGKFSKDIILQIRDRLAKGDLGINISKELKVSKQTISEIKHNKIYAWVNP